MKTDRRNPARPRAWLYPLGVAACLGACAIGGPASLHAQGVRPNRPAALEQLRAAVGLDAREPVESRPRLPEAPAVASEGRGPIRLDRVKGRLDAIAAMNGTAVPGTPPLLPVEALASERAVAPTMREMPTATSADDVPTESAIGPAATPRVAPSWGIGRAFRCLALIGMFCVGGAVLGSRWSGLMARLRVSFHPEA